MLTDNQQTLCNAFYQLKYDNLLLYPKIDLLNDLADTIAMSCARGSA